MAYRATGDVAKAETHLKQRGDRWPDLADPLAQHDDDLLDSPVAYEHRGVEALQRQDWAAAAAAFRRGLELQSDDATLRHWLGAALYAAGDVSGAEREFREVVRRRPDFAKAHFSLGAILEARGDRAAAIESYAAAVRNDPTMIDARLRLAEAQRASGQLQASLEQYQAAANASPATADAWIGGARALLGLRRQAEARLWLTQALRIHPDRRELIELQRELP
jgi:tetratricopeptide (TPR) repeat protein